MDGNYIGLAKSRFTVVTMRNSHRGTAVADMGGYLLTYITLFIDYCLNFHTKDCEPTFAPPCIFSLLVQMYNCSHSREEQPEELNSVFLFHSFNSAFYCILLIDKLLLDTHDVCISFRCQFKFNSI